MLDEKFAIKVDAESTGTDIALKSESDILDRKLAEYENAETAEDKAMRLAYEAIAKGEKVIDIVKGVVVSRVEFGTTQQQDLPTVAFAPHNATHVSLIAHYRAGRNAPFGGDKPAEHSVQFKSDTDWVFPLPTDAITWGMMYRKGGEEVEQRDTEWRVLTPHIPIKVRQEYDVTDPKRLVMFETGPWSRVRDDAKTVPAPKPTLVERWDPMLVRHLVGRLYVVETVWDLTDLEAQLLAGIRGQIDA